VERPDLHVLENDLIRASFDSRSAALVSLVDKETGEEMIDTRRPAGIFRLVQEDDAKGMTAWIVGRWMSVRSLHDCVKVSPVSGGRDSLRQSLSYEMGFGASRLKATVSLDRGSAALAWRVECEWLETGRKGAGIPQLNFFLPAAAECRSFRFDVPFGVVDRLPADMDVPASSWALGVPRKAGRKALLLASGQTHGFRCLDNAVSLTLLRSSFDPDPHPELGVHNVGFSVVLADCASARASLEAACVALQPLTVLSAAPHEGTLPLSAGFLQLEEGTVAVSAVKPAEDSHGKRRMVVRLYETDGKQTTAVIKVSRAPSAAWLADINENRLAGAPAVRRAGGTLSVDVEAATIATLVLEFEEAKP
jgi:alpha-mannosidase